LGVAAAAYVTVNGPNVSQPIPVFACSGGPGSCSATPIDLSSPGTQIVVELYGTGLRHNSGSTSATAGGQQLTVQYAGAQSTEPGLDQVNVLIPTTLAGSGVVAVNLVVDGVAANPVQLAFR
jgi:uncharacterized protein (TIGR03437 family)